MSPATKTPKTAELFGVISSNPFASVAEKEHAMNLAERLVAAYKAVDAAAPALVLGNDISSGYSALANAAVNSLIKYAPAKAKVLARCWAQMAEDEIDRRAASNTP